MFDMTKPITYEGPNNSTSSFSLMSPPEMGQSLDQFTCLDGSSQIQRIFPESTTTSSPPTCLNMAFCGTNAQSQLQVQDLGSRAPLSPPISPERAVQHYIVEPPTSLSNNGFVRDPPLFESSSDNNAPLFTPSLPAIVRPGLSTPQTRPVAKTKRRKPLPSVGPRDPSQYVTLTATVFANLMRDPTAYYDREMQFLEDRRKARRAALLVPKASPVYPVSRQSKPLSSTPLKKDSRSQASGSYPLSPLFRSQARVNKRQPSKPAKPLKTPKTPKTAETSRMDDDYQSVADFCPPLSTLGESNRLKTDWKGTPLPPGPDAAQHLLHEDEQLVARKLRLTSAVYLTQKRKIFRARVQYAKQGLEFRKTDSQKACKIDVNKASQLWTTFNNVGWFDLKHTQPYLHSV